MKYNPYLKTFWVALLVLFLNACATIPGRPFQEVPSTQHIALPALELEPIEVEIAQIELQVPDVNVEVRDIPFRSGRLSDEARVVLNDAEIRCMAEAIYFEARGEGTLGMIGVGYVVMNRMGSPKFKPSTACGIVYERNRRGCQFSWVCDGIPDRVRSPQAFQRAREVAIDVLTRSVENPVGNSIFFRHRAVRSRYASSQQFVTAIGHHGFFAAL